MSKNILVCANGASAKEIDFTRVPKDAKVMRMTSYYFEEKYYAGKRVDYYVEYAKRLVNQYFNIRTINKKGEYEIDMENLWWTVLFESNPHFPTIKSCTGYIQEQQPLIAEFRCFYEYYYGQYLPTGMQALALACCLDFDNIYTAGFDLFSVIKNGSAYTVGHNLLEMMKSVNANRNMYDTTGGVGESSTYGQEEEELRNYIDKTHPLSMQVELIHLLQSIFPHKQILSVCENSAINNHIALAPQLFDTPWYLPAEKPSDRTTDWYPLPDSMPSKKAEA